MMKQLGGVQLAAGGLHKNDRRPHLVDPHGAGPTSPFTSGNKMAPDPSLKALLLGNKSAPSSVPLRMGHQSVLGEVKMQKEQAARTPSPFSRMIAAKKQCSNLSLADQKMMMGGCGSLGSPSAMGGVLGRVGAQSEVLRAEMKQLVANQSKLPEFKRGGHQQNLGQRKATLDVLPSIDLLQSDRESVQGPTSPTSPSRKRVANHGNYSMPGPEEHHTRSKSNKKSSKKAKMRSPTPDLKEQLPSSPAPSPAPGPPRRGSVEADKSEQLMRMCKHGRFEEVQGQLVSGFSVDAQDSEGNTLLITACQNNLKKIVRLCLENDADCLIKNNQGHDALYYCKMHKSASLTDAVTAAIELKASLQ